MDTDTAVILAAGFGRRLDADEDHKLMATVGARPLLSYHVAHFSRLGIRDLVVVTGHNAASLADSLRRISPPPSLSIHRAHNPDFQAQNGLSVLAAATAIDGGVPFWLTMSDHIYDGALFDDIARLWSTWRRPHWEGALFVDTKLDTIFDMPDATKVRTDPDHFAIGKQLRDFDAIDTGLFWCAPGFVDALRTERRACGDCSTSDAVRRLVDARRFGFIDIGAHLWQDIDTPEARDHAEALVRERFIGTNNKPF